MLSNMTLLLPKSAIKAKSNNGLASPQGKTKTAETRRCLEKVRSGWSIPQKRGSYEQIHHEVKLEFAIVPNLTKP